MGSREITRRIAVSGVAVFAVLVSACSSADERDINEPNEIELAIEWSDCEQLVRREAGFSVTAPGQGLHMDGGFEKYDCNEPMKFDLPRDDSYVVELEGRGERTWTFEELEELDFRIAW